MASVIEEKPEQSGNPKFDDDDLESIMLGRSPRFQAMLDRSRQSIRQGKGLSEDEFWEAVRGRAEAAEPPKEKKSRRAKR